MASIPLNFEAYGKLLAESKPAVIATDEEHTSAMERVTELARKGARATREEVALLKLLATLIEDYEHKRWARKRQKFAPREILAFLMEENGLNQSDLADIASQSNISAILAGKRPIGNITALKLAKRFRVSPELFLPLP